MNALPLTRHLLLKDARRERGWLALVWAMAAVMPFVAPRVFAKSTEWVSLSALPCALLLVILIVLARVVRLDPPGREFHFLATRPVSWRVLLASKILFIALFLVVPIWIAKTGTMLTMKIPVSAGDVALLLVENGIGMGALLAAVAFVAMFARGLAEIFASLVVGAIAVAFAYSELEAHLRAAPPTLPVYLNPTLADCRWLMFQLGIIVTVAVVAALRYGRRPLKVALGVTALGLAASFALWTFWPYDLSRIFSGQPQYAGPLPAELHDRITFATRGKENSGNNEPTEMRWNGVRIMQLNHEVTLTGVEPPYFARMVSYHAVATLKSGRTISASKEITFVPRPVVFMRREMMRQMLGLRFDQNMRWGETQFGMFQYRPDEYADADLTGVEIKGEITLEILRASAVGTIPLKPGASATTPRQRYVVENIGYGSVRLDYQLLVPSMQSALRGDTTGFGDNIVWIAYNRNADYLTWAGEGNNGGDGILYSVLVHEGHLMPSEDSSGEPYRKKPIPPDWTDGAQLTFFTAAPCGRITFPYELKNVDLRH